MTCERCTDIHKAQKDGKTQRECGCSCHNKGFATTTGTGTIGFQYTTDTAGNDINLTAGTMDISGDQVF